VQWSSEAEQKGRAMPSAVAPIEHAPVECAPVEYAVAVDRYLDASRISAASRRVYRTALETWAWPLVGRIPPTGPARRAARGPVVPLSRLDGGHAAETVLGALDRRALQVDRATFVREASILRNAAHWWAAQGWIGPHAEAAVKAHGRGSVAPERVDVPAAAGIDPAAVFRLRAPLREQALWRLVYESAAPIERLLALDTSDLDLSRARVRREAEPRAVDRIDWGPLTAEVLPLLTIGRTVGPVFLTERRAAARTPAADRCPYTHRARLSPRRAAELFQQATRILDPADRGWNLRDLRLAGRRARIGARPAVRVPDDAAAGSVAGRRRWS
jgi:integrase